MYEVTSKDLHHIVHTAVEATLLTTDSTLHDDEQPVHCQYNCQEANSKTTTAICQDSSEEDMQDFGMLSSHIIVTHMYNFSYQSHILCI